MPAGNARGTEALIMVVTVPILLVAMFLTWRGSKSARMVWLGTLGYIFYTRLFFPSP